ncbi:MAG TPA: sulfite exporter TauE/SafE family protein, partial [Rhodopila sp.]|uniref:sulfite exporter TauE/SafE family protein n=1 Tax=Rhodopila sp. TaxID=2480087 RepID=UPI002C36C6CD
MDWLHGGLAILCGSLVGFTLGLIGGGGSIMATPLLLYVVGLSPHVAIGTGALAVSANAFSNFGGYARQGLVRWQCAILFSVVGVVGATLGSFAGKQVDGKRLLFLFAILMIVVGVLMLRRKDRAAAMAGPGKGGLGKGGQ